MNIQKDISNKILLDIRNLKTYFYTSRGTVKAVDGIDIKINEGEIVGLAGESACGKSTTALSILRIVPTPGRIINGSILFRGKDLLKLSENEMNHVRGKKISMSFQGPMTYLNPLMKVKSQIAENIHVGGGTKKGVFEKVVALLKKVGIPSPEWAMESYPHTLSGGMRQRVLLAMAISSNPALLILDEPTTALDVSIQMQILELISELQQSLNISLLLITHDLRIMAELCDTLYIMYAGKIVESGSIFDLFKESMHPYTQKLIQSSDLSVDESKRTFITIGGSVPNLINPPSGCRFSPRCQYSKPICTRDAPGFYVKEPKHAVSCWLYY